MGNLIYAGRALVGDLLPTIAFAVMMALKVDVGVVTGVSVAISIVQIAVYALVMKKPVTPLQWASLGLVLVFGAAGMGPDMSAGATVSAIPAGAQVKGTDGPDWTVACVLFEVDATISSQSSIGYGTCERMQWNPDSGSEAGGRWMIAPGTPPMPAPNTWPGSALALKAGWLTWSTAAAAVHTDKAAANAPDNPSGDGAGTPGDTAAN